LSSSAPSRGPGKAGCWRGRKLPLGSLSPAAHWEGFCQDNAKALQMGSWEAGKFHSGSSKLGFFLNSRKTSQFWLFVTIYDKLNKKKSTNISFFFSFCS